MQYHFTNLHKILIGEAKTWGTGLGQWFPKVHVTVTEIFSSITSAFHNLAAAAYDELGSANQIKYKL